MYVYIRTDQSPRFGTHVIHGLIDTFNYHRMKVYHLHAFRDSRSVFCALPLPHTLKRAHAERERRDSDTAFQTTPQRMDTHTHTHKVIFKYPIGKYFGKHSRLCLKLKYTAEKETRCVSVFDPCI